MRHINIKYQKTTGLNNKLTDKDSLIGYLSTRTITIHQRLIHLANPTMEDLVIISELLDGEELAYRTHRLLIDDVETKDDYSYG